MAGIIVLLVFLGAAIAVAATRPSAAAAHPQTERLAAVQRRTRRWRWAGLALGLVAAVAAALLGDELGRGVMLAGPLLALCVLAGVIVGELRVTAPAGPTRQVSLEVRHVADYVPRRLAAAVGAASGLLVIVLAWTTAAGSPDDLGRAGRSLTHQVSEAVVQTRGPWPGSFYSVPLLAIVLAGLLAGAFALHRVVRRPRQGEDVAVDDALRHQASAAVTAALGLLIAIPFTGVSTVAAIVLLGMSNRPAWWSAAGWGLVALTPLLVALAGWCAAVLVAPASAGHVRRLAVPD